MSKSVFFILRPGQNNREQQRQQNHHFKMKFNGTSSFTSFI